MVRLGGTGLAAELIRLLHTHARSVGVTRIEATVRAANHRGVALYQKMGYAIEGKRRRAAIIDGVGHDEYHIGILF